MTVTKYRWGRRSTLIGLILVVFLVGYVERKPLFLLSKPLLEPLVNVVLNTPEFKGLQLSKNAKTQAEDIHAWITEYARTIKTIRHDTNESKSPEHLRKELQSLLGSYSACPDEHSLTLQHLYSNESYTLNEVQISVCSGELHLAGLIATPNLNSSPPPLIIALHGTAAGPEVLFDGWGDDRRLSYQVEDYHNSMGSVLAKAGFTVFAPQLITEKKNKPIVGFNRTRNELHMRLSSLGFTLHGIELTMIMRALTALSTDSRVSYERESVGVYGVSLGGETAFYLAALDERIKASVISQYIEDRDKKLFGTLLESNWRFPSGTYAFKQGFSNVFSDTEMLKLILPRAIFIEAGIKDEQRTQSALNMFVQWREEFPVETQDGTICLEIGTGGHSVQLRESIPWLKTKLINHYEYKPFCRN